LHTFHFASSEEVTSAFHGSAVAILILLAIAAALLYMKMGARRAPRIRALFVAWLAAAAISIEIARTLYHSEFTESRIQEHQVTLRFAAPTDQAVVFASADVHDVLFGFPDKHNRTCYIRLKLKDGTSFRSVAKRMPPQSCKALRLEYLSQLAK
jgi:hypothetical protein